ncbi:MAG: AEC family transporter [Lachnospiraceae bacterium]|nr:AEC family transporter [Lachnospiraceae bacterium]
MEIAAILLRQIVIMFLFMMIGAWLYRTDKLTKAGSKDLGNVLIYVIMPCVVLNAYMTEFSRERLTGLLWAFGLSVAALLLAMLVSHVIFKKHPIENFGTAFSNAGFMGIPLVSAVLGTEAVFYTSAFVALLNILQWTYGVFVITRDRKQISVNKILTNPVLISLAAGIVLFLLPIELPGVLTGTVSSIAAMNAPVAMISLGTYLAQTRLKELFTDKTAYLSTLVRLLVIPLLTLALLWLVPAEYMSLKLAVLIVAITPVGSNVAIFAQIHNQNYTQAVKSVCLSTLCSIVTMPLLVALARLVWGA